MGPILDVVIASFDYASEVAKSMVSAYVEAIKKLSKLSIITALITLPLPIVGSLLHLSWMNEVYLAVAAILIVIWLMAVSPIGWLIAKGHKEVDSIRKTSKAIGGVLFWLLLLAIYFYLVPVWNHLEAIPLVFIICAVLAFGLVLFGIAISPKLAISAVLIIFLLVTVSFFLPASRSAANTFVGWIDKKVAGYLEKPLHQPPSISKPHTV